ncbi:response regulator transcription factor [Nitratireductor sp. XY-223]|uniref:response regulator transcription factor n=1 Tax=Nitratireductor sp. XY-223 TaxID=2561926 RepID=UPI0010A9DDEC|nr:response regulator transcription factor [Nitratireductor sp. XY-223]
MALILVVDDDPHIIDVVAFALERAGHLVSRAGDGDEALMMARSGNPDLIVLDVGLPKRDGLEVCRLLRSEDRFSDLPILFLSALDEEVDRIVGLEMGADDYVTKPFSPRELTARVSTILRRSGPKQEARGSALSHGVVCLDSDRAEATCNGDRLSLTALEMSILQVLLKRPGTVFSRGRIIEFAYDGNIHVSDRTIDSHIRNLRSKFAAAGCSDVIETVPRLGFRLGACTIASPQEDP